MVSIAEKTPFKLKEIQPKFFGDEISQGLRRHLLRRLLGRGVRFIVRKKNRILALTLERRQIFIAVSQQNIRSVNIWHSPDALTARTVAEYGKLKNMVLNYRPE